MLGGENIHPQPDIGDNFFDFTQLQGKQFNFEDIFTATIVVDSDKYTYWKVERYINNVLDRSYYFYTSRVLSILKSAFTLELVLDTYLTYTRNVFKDLRGKTPYIERGTINKAYLGSLDTDTTNMFLKSLSNVEEGIVNGEQIYSSIEPIPLLSTTGIKTDQYYPITLNGMTAGGDIFNPFYGDPGTHNRFLYWTTGGSSTVINGEFSIVDNKGGQPKYYEISQVPNSPTPIWVKEPKYKYIAEDINTGAQITGIWQSDNEIIWDKANNNIVNGYFAVFFNKSGEIDAYPIIEDITIKYWTPHSVVRGAKGSTLETTNLGSPDTRGRVYRNRIYKTGMYNNDTLLTTKLYNSWDAIKRDFIDSGSSQYALNSFLGIYKGLYSIGSTSKLCFEYGDFLNHICVAHQAGGVDTWAECRFIHPKRLLYRFKPYEAMRFTIQNGAYKFNVVDSTIYTLPENYINLLEPICFGSSELIPARYIFEGEKIGSNITYAISLWEAFSGGFKLFGDFVKYNSPALGFSLGGTLAVQDDSYVRKMEQIELQKNAGIASSVANIFARPLNWLSFGASTGSQFGLNDTLRNSVGQSMSSSQSYNALWQSPSRNWVPYGTDPRTHSANVGKNWGRDIAETMYNTTGTRSSINVGGLGGFLGDFVSIGNLIKQTNYAKKNLGMGYISTTDDDIFSAIQQSTYVNKVSHQPLLRGLYSVGYRKKFDNRTRELIKYHYENFGFQISNYVPNNYIQHIIDSVNRGETGFVSVNKDWMLMNLPELANYNDNVVRNAILDQLAAGIRMRRFT